MATRSDPLSILRDFHISKKDVQIRDDLVIFDDIAFKKDARTNYLKYGEDKNSHPIEGYYSLECLVYFLKHIDLRHPQYVQKASAEQMEAVRRPDRKDLVSYLTGETDSTDRINKMAKIALHVPFKRTAEETQPVVRRPRIESEKLIRDREKLVARLEAPKDQSATVSTEKLISLSDAIPVEKLAALKAKRLAKKRGTIRADDDMPGAGDLPAIGDTDTDLQEILSRERVCRTRNDITKGTKDLTSRLAPIFAMIKSKEEGRTKKDPVSQPVKPSIPAAKPAPLPAVYSRYDQEQFTKPDVTDFGINTMSSYRGAPSAKSEAAPGKGPSPSVDQANPADGQRKRPSKTPIILIPSAPTSLITMYNCLDILQDNKFIPTETRKDEINQDKTGTKKYESDICINRKKVDGSINPIRVMDNPSKLSVEDWDRVVAVFVQGQAWQFKGWPWSGNPVEIFDKIKAFHLKFDEMPTDKNVAAWNVSVIPISRNKRHLDRASLLKFWEGLDKFVAKNKPYLRW